MADEEVCRQQSQGVASMEVKDARPVFWVWSTRTYQDGLSQEERAAEPGEQLALEELARRQEG